MIKAIIFDLGGIVYATDWGGLNKKFRDKFGFDIRPFKSEDMGEMKEKVSSYINEGNQNGITGTPTFFIGSKTIIGAQPYENFRMAIETALSG